MTSAVCLALFSVGAFYGVKAIRSGAVQLRVVSVVDGIDGVDGAWRTDYSGIFAPDNDDYPLEGLKGDEWWSSVAQRGSNEGEASRRIICAQGDGGNTLESVPISIWTMQCLTCESATGELPFAAKVIRDGRKVEVTVTNRSKRMLRDGSIRLKGDLVMRFGKVPPGQSETFTGSVSNDVTGQGVVDANGFNPEQAYFARGTIQRTRGIEERLDKGAAVVGARYNDNIAVDYALVGGVGTYNHVLMARQVVTPEEGDLDE